MLWLNCLLLFLLFFFFSNYIESDVDLVSECMLNMENKILS